MKKQNRTYYPLTLSENVSILQLTFSLDKRIINIPVSMTWDKEMDHELLKKAWNIVADRNDCLRIKISKPLGKPYRQYFADKVVYDVPELTFKTKEQFDKWILKTRKIPIKYKKGVEAEPKIITTWEGKTMFFIKYAHPIIDMYGVGFIWNELNLVYDALKNGTEMPPMPGKFEDVVKADLAKQKENKEWFPREKAWWANWLHERECPWWAGMAGVEEPIWNKKCKAKGRRNVPMFFLRNQTNGYIGDVNPKLCELVNKFAEQQKVTPTNIYYYIYNVVLSKLNGDTENMMPLELINMRGTKAERNCAGCKVQSSPTYATVKKDQTFIEGIQHFAAEQMNSMRHVGFDDTEFQWMWRKEYKAPMLGTFFTMTFGLVPMKMIPGTKVDVYDNGKFSLPLYLSLVMDVDTGYVTQAVYQYQTLLTKECEVVRFHRMFQELGIKLLENADKPMGEINVSMER